MINHLRLTITTPVFIGNNSYLSPFSDYFFLGGNLYYISINHLIQNLPENKVDAFLQNFYSSLASKEFNKKNISDILKSVDIDPLSISRFSVPCFMNPNNKNVRKFVSTADKIYIPGSSIKGIIRTSILYDYIKNNSHGQESLEVFLRKFRTAAQVFLGRQKEVLNLDYKRKTEKNIGVKISIRRKVEGILNPIRQRINTILKILESDLFGNDPDYDFMKQVIIHDSNEIAASQCIQIEETRRIRFSNKRIIGSPIFSEMARENSSFEFKIKFNNEIRIIHNKDYFDQFDIKKIVEIINSYSRDQIMAELKLYRKDEYFSNVILFNRNLLELKPDKSLMRLGANKTFLFNTISNLIPDSEFRMFREIMRIGENPFTGELTRFQFPSSQRFITRKNEIHSVPGWCFLEIL